MPFTTVAPPEVTPHTIVAGKERYLGFNVHELLTGLISEVVFVGVNFRSVLQEIKHLLSIKPTLILSSPPSFNPWRYTTIILAATVSSLLCQLETCQLETCRLRRRSDLAGTLATTGLKFTRGDVSDRFKSTAFKKSRKPTSLRISSCYRKNHVPSVGFMSYLAGTIDTSGSTSTEHQFSRLLSSCCCCCLSITAALAASVTGPTTCLLLFLSPEP
ncbi:hypothetical protein LXL04_011523 [Taraxacum kok-saghyz]